jgi:UDP-N-acetylglucosamine acyltransferase
MVKVHATALVDPGAKLGTNVEIGPFCVIGPHVVLGDDVVVHSHASITSRTTLGAGCKVFPFVSLGAAPQDIKFHDEPSTLTIGSNTLIREYVTINPGTERGHVAIGEGAIIGGLSAVHQYVRIGAYAFVGGMSGITADVIPFGMAIGNRANLCGLNIVGLKRKGFPREQIHELRQAYRMMFASEGTLMERLEDVEPMFDKNPLVKQIIDFIKTQSERSFCVPNNAATPSP